MSVSTSALMRSPGRICARMTILEKVWDYDFDPGTNLVDAAVVIVHVANAPQSVPSNAFAHNISAPAVGPPT